MNDNKTLVEQIRKMVEESYKEDIFPEEFGKQIIGHEAITRDDVRMLYRTIADRIEREYMQLPLDADGVPIKPGDNVFLVEGFEHYEVYGFEFKNDKTLVRIVGGDRQFIHVSIEPKKLTHKEPDTLERIEADVMEELWHYWGCSGARCDECPALIDGKTPKEHYHTGFCEEAKMLDLLRRQREVLERGQA